MNKKFSEAGFPAPNQYNDWRSWAASFLVALDSLSGETVTNLPLYVKDDMKPRDGLPIGAEGDTIRIKDEKGQIGLYSFEQGAWKNVGGGSFDSIYPVGAIYITTNKTCPLQEMGIGTWSLVSQGRVLQGAASEETAGDMKEAGLPNITGSYTPGSGNGDTWSSGTYKGALYYLSSGQKGAAGSDYSTNSQYGVGFDASRSNSIYGKSTTVQPPAFLVNIFKRVS